MMFKFMKMFRRKTPASPAGLVISCSGQATPRPSVHLSMAGPKGSITLYTRPHTDQGHAQIESYAKTLHHITNIEIYDQRSEVERELFALRTPTPFRLD